MYKINYEDTLHSTVFYNYKWSVTFKNHESLCCISETYNIAYQLHLERKEGREEMAETCTDFMKKKYGLV